MWKTLSCDECGNSLTREGIVIVIVIVILKVNK